MAFDGITVSSIVKELKDKVEGLRIYKISQPEADELMLILKGNSMTLRLLVSADASLPLVYLSDDNKPSPMQAPGFCMLLRKHLTNAKVISITQPGLERVISFELEHLNEMGDVCRKFLIVELMGKYSNIIFTDEKHMILDSIKHISHNVSSVREVLPGRDWFIPLTEGKLDLFTVSFDTLYEALSTAHMPLFKALYTTLTGFSPVLANELCYRAGLDGEASSSACSKQEFETLFHVLKCFKDDLCKGNYTPTIYYDGNSPKEYEAVPLSIYESLPHKEYTSVSALLSDYYKEKAQIVRIRQKSSDLRKITQTALERNVKKLDLQTKQLEDTKKREKYRIYGELLNAYGYSIPAGLKSYDALNYYTSETVTIPLDPDLSAIDNAKKYFDKYGKLKRTYESLTEIIKEVSEEVEHLKSIMTSLDIAVLEEDLTEIKEELIASGYIRYKNTGKKVKITSKPFHYISSDGFDMYVGKNNFQNDTLTFEFANGNDWWFHAKKMPGSHVVVKCNNKEIPDRTFEEAARLAAYYSSGRANDKVEIDYTIKKNVKKPAGAKPGFVVYYTNYSMTIDTDISNIQQV